MRPHDAPRWTRAQLVEAWVFGILLGAAVTQLLIGAVRALM